MLRIIIVGLLLFSFVPFSCRKLDNYKSPDGGIYGRLIDRITNENLQTEQPDGFSIKLFEKGGQVFSPISFFGKPDGTFENSWIFRNEYKVLPTEGAFFPVDTITVNVDTKTETTFEVMPFLAVANANITASPGKIISTYTIARAQVGDKIAEAKTLVSKVPTVNNIVFDFKAESDLMALDDSDILASTYSQEVGGLASGATYYVRIAVRTDNALKRYNYSKTFTITVP